MTTRSPAGARSPWPAGSLLSLGLAGIAAAWAGLPGPSGPGPLTAEIGIHYSHYEPDRLVVAAGQPVTIVLRNGDPIDHEWIVGDEATHERHRTGTEPAHGGAPDRGVHPGRREPDDDRHVRHARHVPLHLPPARPRGVRHGRHGGRHRRLAAIRPDRRRRLSSAGCDRCPAPYDDIAAGRPASIAVAGPALLGSRLLTKDLAFDATERDAFRLRGLLPDRILTIEEQIELELEHLRHKDDALEQYIGLAALQDRNATLFYRLLAEHLEEFLPIVYTPTVGRACQEFSHIIRRTRGTWITPADRDRIPELLRQGPYDDVRLIVVTDNERILGLGDQGAGGMAIPIGKLALYTAASGIHPALTLPVSLDVGTDNPALLADPLYLGYRAPRLRGPDYDALVEAFVDGRGRGVARLRHPVGGLQAGQRAAHPRPLPRPRPVVQRRHPGHRRGRRRRACWPALRGARHGSRGRRAGRAGRRGRRRDRDRPAAPAGDARRRDDRGRGRGGRSSWSTRAAWSTPDATISMPTKRELALPAAAFAGYGFETASPGWSRPIERVRPTVLVGTTGVGGHVQRGRASARWRAGTDRPIVMPLSNPTSAAEATPADVLRWTDGRAIVATGSPFDAVEVDGVRREIGQANNVFIFPGVGPRGDRRRGAGHHRPDVPARGPRRWPTR